MDFRNKVALVTGASRGIGREIALQLAAAKAQVAIHYHQDRHAAEMTVAQISGEGHRLFQANLGESDEVKQLVDQVIREMGKIDILVNNAGIFIEHKLTSATFDEWQNAWQRTMNVNLLGPANCMYWTSLHMMEKGGGRIVNVSSRGAFRGEPDAPAYGASKAGLNALSQSLAKTLAPHNIFVCVVAPGFVETDMASDSLVGPRGDSIRSQSPMGRVARADEVARTVLFLASEGTDFLTGCIVDINGASYLRT